MGVTGMVHETPGEGATVEWYTPPWLFELLGLEFDVDVCSPGPDVVPWVPARRHILEAENGLITPWEGRAWMNHPYAHDDAEWVNRFLSHGHGVGICHARTDVPWCKRLQRECDLVVFTKRIQFVDATGNPPLRWNKKLQKWQKSSPGCGQMLFARGAVEAMAILEAANDPRIDGAPMYGHAA